MKILVLTKYDLPNIKDYIKLQNIGFLLKKKYIPEIYIKKLKKILGIKRVFYFGYTKIKNSELTGYSVLNKNYSFYSNKEKKGYTKILYYYIFVLNKNIIFYSYEFIFNNNKLQENNWNRYYIENIGKIPWGEKKQDKHIEVFFNAFLINKKKLTILDVGCGVGNNSYFLKKKGFNVIGIDISSNAIQICNKKYENIDFINKDIINISNTNNLDVIIDCGCLHVNHPIKQDIIIKKYENIIDKNGIIFIRLFKGKGQITSIDNLPIYGIEKKDINKKFKNFNIINIKYDSSYGDNGCFYIVIQKNDRLPLSLNK